MSRKTEGELVRKMREVSGLTITDVVTQTGIPNDIIEAIEDGDSVREEVLRRVTDLLSLALDNAQGRLLPGADKVLAPKKGTRKKRK